MAKAKKVIGAGPTCKCTPGGFVWIVLGAIILALGFFALIKGLMLQWQEGANWIQAGVWYAVGFLVLFIGKCVKMKGCVGCPVHRV